MISVTFFIKSHVSKRHFVQKRTMKEKKNIHTIYTDHVWMSNCKYRILKWTHICFYIHRYKHIRYYVDRTSVWRRQVKTTRRHIVFPVNINTYMTKTESQQHKMRRCEQSFCISARARALQQVAPQRGRFE